jgi:hypothetical protein
VQSASHKGRDVKTISAPLWGEDRCKAIARIVKRNRDLWIDRGGFYTIGAATYQDTVAKDYLKVARSANCHIADVFFAELTDIEKKLMALLDIDIARRDDTALPGFHVFDARASGRVGHVHIDKPHLSIDWGQAVVSKFSFTVLVEAPEGGAGMDVWPDHADCTGEQMDIFAKSGELPEHVYMPYVLGELIIHDGLTPHRIANPANNCAARSSDHRITMQGHGATLADGKTCLYF